MRILLADDEVTFVLSLAKILRGEGYAVDVAHDGQSAYDLAIDTEYDLIVLDIGMPRMNGITVCQQLRSEAYVAPILMLTARDAKADTVLGLDSGADDYVVKPFDVDELLARMRSLLRRNDNRKSPMITIEDLQLDTSKRVAWRDGQELELSAKEFALLEFLLRYQGHVLSKQQILEHVWDGEIDPFSNVVDVYIGYLRAKIDKPFSGAPLLRTVKGMGYRIG
jgi:DNA-binding response OmpR family regulator